MLSGENWCWSKWLKSVTLPGFRVIWTKPTKILYSSATIYLYIVWGNFVTLTIQTSGKFRDIVVQYIHWPWTLISNSIYTHDKTVWQSWCACVKTKHNIRVIKTISKTIWNKIQSLNYLLKKPTSNFNGALSRGVDVYSLTVLFPVKLETNRGRVCFSTNMSSVC